MTIVGKSFREVIRGVVLAAVMSAASVRATDYVWTGAGDGATWNSTANWEGGTKFVSSTANRLIFSNQVANAVVTVPTSINVNRIKFAKGCKAMRLTGASGTTQITDTYLKEALTDSPTETNASIFVETTEPIVMDIVQVMTGGRSVGLAQGAHLEILKPIRDNSEKKGRVYFRTLGASLNSYLKIDYDPTSTTYALDPKEGSFLFQFVGGTNEITAAVCATEQASPKPVAVDSGLLRLNAGTYPREIQVSGAGPVLETVGAVSFTSNVTVTCSYSTLDFGGATTALQKLCYTYAGTVSTSNQKILFGGDASFADTLSVTAAGGTYTFDLDAGVTVDFAKAVSVKSAALFQRIPTTSRINYRDTVACGSFCDGTTEPDAGHRGGEIHLYKPLTVSGDFYLRGYNVICEAANVFPSGVPITWRYEYDDNCGIVDMNGFDQTTTHLKCIGNINSANRNYLTSATPCTLTINDTCTSASAVLSTVGAKGAVSIVHTGTQTQVFTNRNVEVTGDITITSGEIELAGTSAITSARRIFIGSAGKLVLSGSAATPISADTVIYLTSDDDGVGTIDAFDYKGTSLTLANRIYLNGTLISDGTYTSSNATWLNGAKITVTVAYPELWLAATDGNWATDTAKWSKGRSPTSGEAAFVDADGTDYTVSITADNAALGPLTLGNRVGTATLSVGANVSWPAWSTVTVNDGGRLLVGDGGALAYNSYEHNGNNFVLSTGGTLELTGSGTAEIATQSKDCPPILQKGGDIVAGGTSQLTFKGSQTVYLGSGTTTLKDSAVLKGVTGQGANGKNLNDIRFYTARTVDGVTNRVIVKDAARIDGSKFDQFIAGYATTKITNLTRLDFDSTATSELGYQLELGGTWGYAEMNVSKGLVKLGNYGIGVGGFYYSGRAATDANVVGVLNVTGGAVDVNATSFNSTKNRVRGFLLGEGWYDKKTATSQNLFTGYVNLSGGVISNRCGAVILGAGAAKGVWTQTGGRFENTSVQTKGPMILGWLGGEGTFILSNGTVNVASANVATYVGGAETNLTPWVLEKQAPSSADAATGLLSLQGGTFTTAGDVIVGQDGNGTVELGPAGVLNARKLELMVADATGEKPAHTATLKFTAGESACGRITLSDAMTSVAGAKFEFDLTAWDKASRLRFVSCRGLSGTAVPWDNITFKGVEKSDFLAAGGTRFVYRQNASGILIDKLRGMAVSLR